MVDGRVAGRLTSTVVRHVLVFWVISFLITWGLGISVVLSTQSQLVNGANISSNAITLSFGEAVALVILSGFGPMLSAIIVSAYEARGKGVRKLMIQIVHWRTNPLWYLAGFSVPVLLTLVAAALWLPFSGNRSNFQWIGLPPIFQLFGLPIGPWGEEFGWRGYALPALQTKLRWPQASVIVGLMWFGWHQWPLFTPAAGTLDLVGLGIFLVYIVSASVIIGWVYNRGRQLLPLAWCGHAGLNLVGPSLAPFTLVTVIFAIFAIMISNFPRPKPRSLMIRNAAGGVAMPLQ